MPSGPAIPTSVPRYTSIRSSHSDVDRLRWINKRCRPMEWPRHNVTPLLSKNTQTAPGVV